MWPRVTFSVSTHSWEGIGLTKYYFFVAAHMKHRLIMDWFCSKICHKNKNFIWLKISVPKISLNFRNYGNCLKIFQLLKSAYFFNYFTFILVTDIHWIIVFLYVIVFIEFIEKWINTHKLLTKIFLSILSMYTFFRFSFSDYFPT